MKGEIIASFSVKCGDCGEFGQSVNVVNMELAIDKFEDRGWKHTTEQGWVCPICVRKEARSSLEPYQQIKDFIEQAGYTYSPEDIITAYSENKSVPRYVSHTMKICFNNLSDVLDQILESRKEPHANESHYD